MTIRQVLPSSSDRRKAVGSPDRPSAESVQIQLEKIHRPLDSTCMGWRQKVPSSGNTVS